MWLRQNFTTSGCGRPYHPASASREIAPDQPRVPIGFNVQVSRVDEQNTSGIDSRNVTGPGAVVGLGKDLDVMPVSAFAVDVAPENHFHDNGDVLAQMPKCLAGRQVPA